VCLEVGGGCWANTYPRAALLQLVTERQQWEGFHSHCFCHYGVEMTVPDAWRGQRVGQTKGTCTRGSWSLRATAVQLQASVRAVRGALSALAAIPGLSSGQLGLVRWGCSRLAAATARRALQKPICSIKSTAIFSLAATGQANFLKYPTL
jgi:hypothetical protein